MLLLPLGEGWDEGRSKIRIMDLNSKSTLIASDVLSSREISASLRKTLALSQRERGLKP